METSDWRKAYIADIDRRRDPDAFQFWKRPDPEGDKLVLAVFVFAPEGLRNQIALQVNRMDQGFADRATLETLHEQCWAWLRQQLQDGRLIARGRRLPGGAVQEIERDLLDDVQADFGNNRLMCCGEAYGSVRVFAQPANDGQAAYRSGMAGRPTSLSLLLDELRRRHEAGEMELALAKEAVVLAE